MTDAEPQSGDDEYRAFKLFLVEAANHNQSLMDGTTEPLKKIIGSHDIVAALWNEPREPDGVGMIFVKGEALARRSAESGRGLDVRATAIACIELDQALALRDTLGDGGADSRH